MKVLFAVNNEKISESIIKKYQQEYKEIISGKNVYYFNAISKELQKDKSYDRIVISEDLEPFANNNYEVIDKFIFEKLDNISDEATSNDGQDIPIILICADRRVKSEALLVKIFGIGIYSALLGQDRSITKVCELINKPRSKKDAKVYYKIDSDNVDYVAEGEGDVSEMEIQNILNHYKRLGKNEDQYVNSFDNIASQYTDAQLRVICKFLPLNVRAVLEANSPKYQELVTFGTVPQTNSTNNKKKKTYEPNNKYYKNTETKKDITAINIGGKTTLTKPVVIPSSRNISNVKKINESSQKAYENVKPEVSEVETNIEKSVVEEPIIQETLKRKRGRPRKVETQEDATEKAETIDTPKRKRGRPRKIQQPQEEADNILPGFSDDSDDIEEKTESVNLFDLGNEEEDNQEQTSGGIILPGFEEDEEETIQNQPTQQSASDYEPQQNFDNIPPQQSVDNAQPQYTRPNTESRQIENTNSYQNQNIDLNNLLTRDKKVVAFVGTSKNGTSFLVNNLGEILSKKGIKTAILDLTKNKNAYYIYTQNEEELRKKAFSCINNLKNGIADGIEVNHNLTVYTTVPEEREELEDYSNILKTLIQNYSLVLMDCDFDTNYGYFDNAQELYLVQSFDILTIQPLTAFLRDLKTRNILKPEKLRIVLNKVLRVRSVTERTIIGGMAFYNDPAMSFMTELFNKDTVQYCTIPFEEQTYSKYLEGLVNCQITTNGYSKNLMMSLDKLSNLVYTLLPNNDKNYGKFNSYNPNSGFSNNMNNTLNRMRNNY